MSIEVHPRIEARRREVHEHGTHRRLRWVLALMLLLGLAALGYWLVQSPLLAVDRIVVTGDLDQATVVGVAADAGVKVGDPIAFVRGGRLRAALVADPRIADARVSVHYPHEVAIVVLAHRPVAWVESLGGWLHVTAEGHVTAIAGEPGAGPRVAVGPARASAGQLVRDGDALAAVAFVARLPADLAATATVGVADRGLVAVVAGHDVVLGAPVRMADKAAAVVALAGVVEPGAALDVSAPDRPAVLPPSGSEPPADEPAEAPVEG